MITKRLIYDWPLRVENTNEIRYVENVFDSIDCQDIIQIGNELGLEEGKVYNDGQLKYSEEIRKSKVNFIPVQVDELGQDNTWVFKQLTDMVVEQNSYFGFDLTRIQSLQIGKYGVGDYFTKHIDKLPSSYSNARKLSFILQLSHHQAYDGGDFILHCSSTPFVAPKKQGTMIIFPSYTLHEVTPITRGVRYSLVGWVEGPNFK